jgi:gag-polyprotein putative aspartyl protease
MKGPPGRGGRQRRQRRMERKIWDLGTAGGTAELIKVEGEIAGRSAVFLVDSGATTEFIDEEFVQRAGLTLKESDSKIRLADGSIRGSGGVARAEYTLRWEGRDKSGGTARDGGFEVTKLSGYDAILGLSWLKEVKPRFVWGGPAGVQLQVPRRDGNGRQTWRTLRAAPSAAGGPQECAQARMEASKDDGAAAMHEAWRRVKERKRREEEEDHAEEERPRTKAEEAVVGRLLAEFADVFPPELPAGLV